MANTRIPRIIGAILKLLFTLLIMSVCAIILWRILFSEKVPKEVKNLTQTPELSALSQSSNPPIMQYQDLASITRGKDNYGYFSVEDVVFLPQINQVQILFRYNNSTLGHLAKDKNLPNVPEKSGTYFDVSLVKTTDLTPEDKTDNLDPATLSAQRINPTDDVRRGDTALYTYFRYVFNDVSIDDLTDGVYVDVYYLGDLDYSKPAYGTLCIYAYDEEWKTVKP